MSLPTVEEALATMLGAVSPLGGEAVSVWEADGRWLAQAVLALRDQPPFSASAMDGWAVRQADAVTGAELRIVGESAAGRGLTEAVGPGQAARIFTGAPLPPGAERVVVQEDAERRGDIVVVTGSPSASRHVRARACDFADGQRLLENHVRLNPWRVALAAAAGCDRLLCGARPRVALLATGDELVEPGQPVGDHQIYNSGTPALAAFVGRHGGLPVVLPATEDSIEAIAARMGGDGFDILVTVGGASVGDHDLVKPAALTLGAEILVDKVAMRPGKPVWFARLPDGRPILGLPGNPASGLVCAELFLGPLLAVLQGGKADSRFETAILAQPLAANGPRDHYIRAAVEAGDDGARRVRPFADQDSSLVTVMAAANALIRRPPFAPAVEAGAVVAVFGPTL
ncbi:molybdopterin molybdotransferase MoeA [Brevundimonas sp. Marseille-Q4549]